MQKLSWKQTQRTFLGDKHCKLFIPGKTVAEMKSAARKEKAKEDPSKKPLKAKAFAPKTCSR